MSKILFQISSSLFEKGKKIYTKVWKWRLAEHEGSVCMWGEGGHRCDHTTVISSPIPVMTYYHQNVWSVFLIFLSRQLSSLSCTHLLHLLFSIPYVATMSIKKQIYKFGLYMYVRYIHWYVHVYRIIYFWKLIENIEKFFARWFRQNWTCTSDLTQQLQITQEAYFSYRLALSRRIDIILYY